MPTTDFVMYERIGKVSYQSCLLNIIYINDIFIFSAHVQNNWAVTDTTINNNNNMDVSFKHSLTMWHIDTFKKINIF